MHSPCQSLLSILTHFIFEAGFCGLTVGDRKAMFAGVLTISTGRDVSTLTAIHGLNEKQTAFVVNLRQMSASDAAAAAGYEGKVAHVYLLSIPAVLQAIHADVQRNLQADIWANIRVLRKLRDDVGVSAKVRADVAVKLTNLAGHVVPTHRDEKPSKALSDMTQAELLEHIERNQAAIEKAEAELMAKAKDITPGASVPDSVSKTQATPAKPLNYLD